MFRCGCGCLQGRPAEFYKYRHMRYIIIQLVEPQLCSAPPLYLSLSHSHSPIPPKSRNILRHWLLNNKSSTKRSEIFYKIKRIGRVVCEGPLAVRSHTVYKVFISPSKSHVVARGVFIQGVSTGFLFHGISSRPSRISKNSRLSVIMYS